MGHKLSERTRSHPIGLDDIEARLTPSVEEVTALLSLGRDANGKRRQKWHGGFPTREEAEVARTKIVGDLHDGRYTEPTKLTLRQWVEDK